MHRYAVHMNYLVLTHLTHNATRLAPRSLFCGTTEACLATLYVAVGGESYLTGKRNLIPHILLLHLSPQLTHPFVRPHFHNFLCQPIATNMHLRPYHHLDIAALADIQLQCDKTDPLACYMSQNTDKYPATYRHTTLRFLRTKLLEPGTVAFVVETDDADDWPSVSSFQRSSDTIIGWSIWTRHGNSLVARDWQRQGRTVACGMTAHQDAVLYNAC